MFARITARCPLAALLFLHVLVSFTSAELEQTANFASSEEESIDFSLPEIVLADQSFPGEEINLQNEIPDEDVIDISALSILLRLRSDEQEDPGNVSERLEENEPALRTEDTVDSNETETGIRLGKRIPIRCGFRRLGLSLMIGYVRTGIACRYQKALQNFRG